MIVKDAYPGRDVEGMLSELVKQALEVRPLSREQALWVLSYPEERVVELVGAVHKVRRKFFGDRVKLNALVNIKSGLCPEDCHYCSQSKVSTAGIQKYPYLETEEVLLRAAKAREAGAKRLCLVASGRGPTQREIGRFAETVREVRNRHPELEICACLGLLKDGQAEELKSAGVHAYNHNLNTSEGFYGEICSTHTYEDRGRTVNEAKRSGLSPCSGTLFGMGETDDDVVDVAFALRELGPDSVPINFLIPIPGTPLVDKKELTPQRCLKILALFRLVFPDVEVRIAGGREVHLRSLQPLGLLLANAIFVGDYLTTEGQAASKDLEMISDLGLVVESAEERTLPRERVGGVVLKNYSG
jgi:biotin synthase